MTLLHPHNLNALRRLTTITGLVDNLNTTNDPCEDYFTLTSITVHLLHSSLPSHTAVIDSGAFPMMFTSKKFFLDLQPWHGKISHVTLADGTSKTPILGYGIARFSIDNKYVLEFHNSIYVPNLSTNLFSLRKYIKYSGCFAHTGHNSFTLAFPTFSTEANISDEISINIAPTTNPPNFSTLTTPIYNTSSSTIQPHAHHMSPPPLTSLLLPSDPPIINSPELQPTDPTSTINHDLSHSNKTKSQNPPSPLNNPTPSSTNNISQILSPPIVPKPTTSPDPSDTPSVPLPNSTSTDPLTSTPEIIRLPPPTHSKLPSWFTHNTKITFKLKQQDSFQKGILISNPPDMFTILVGRTRKQANNIPITRNNLLSAFNNNFILRGHDHLIRSLNPSTLPPNFFNTDTEVQRPLLPTEYKPMSSDPSTTSFATDQLRKAFGFCNIDSILPQIQ